jgi:hypothetical protein
MWPKECESQKTRMGIKPGLVERGVGNTWARCWCLHNGVLPKSIGCKIRLTPRRQGGNMLSQVRIVEEPNGSLLYHDARDVDVVWSSGVSSETAKDEDNSSARRDDRVAGGDQNRLLLFDTRKPTQIRAIPPTDLHPYRSSTSPSSATRARRSTVPSWPADCATTPVAALKPSHRMTIKGVLLAWLRSPVISLTGPKT